MEIDGACAGTDVWVRRLEGFGCFEGGVPICVLRACMLQGGGTDSCDGCYYKMLSYSATEMQGSGVV